MFSLFGRDKEMPGTRLFKTLSALCCSSFLFSSFIASSEKYQQFATYHLPVKNKYMTTTENQIALKFDNKKKYIQF